MPLPSINQSSNPGGFSDNFKQKASSLKDKFSPQKLLGGLFGNSKTGDSKLGADTAGRKNPQRTSISSGSNARLKTGDSLADIMAKQLIFMQKTYESDKERYDMERAHREEQMEEDERRHRKLIEGLKKVKKQTAIPEKEKEQNQEEKKDGTPSWLSKMLNGIKAAIFTPFKIILGVVSSVLGAVGSLVMGLGGIILSVIEGSIAAVMKILNSPLTSFVTSIVKTLLGSLFKELFKGLISLGPILASLTLPMAAALGAIGVGVAAIGSAAYIQNQQMQKKVLHEGVDTNKTNELLSDFEYSNELAKQAVRDGTGSSSEKAKRIAELEAQYAKDIAGLKENRNTQLKNREKAIVTPAMAAIGFTPRYELNEKERKILPKQFPDGRLKYFDKSGKEAEVADYKKALEPPKVPGNEESMLEKMNKGLKGLVENNLNPLSNKIEELQSDASLRLDSIGKNVQDLRGDFQRGYDAEMNRQNSISSQTNNMSGNGKIQSSNPIKSHHPHIQRTQFGNAEVV